MHYPGDDSDMKIAGQPNPQLEQDPAEQVREELSENKRNGNLERARQLGALMAGEVWAYDGESCFGEDSEEDEIAKIQRHILFAFAVVNAFDRFTPNNLCAQTALNMFYDTLKEDAPSIYETVKDTSAFSFYYLALRSGSNLEYRVGHTFAMLCGKENCHPYEELGTALFLRFTDVAKKICDDLQFVA